MEWEYQPVDKNDAFYTDFPKGKKLPSDNLELGQDGLEDDFII
jgi:hypothetical protein